jgi:hypothetical protein
MYINLTDLALLFGAVFAYSLLLCWFFSTLIPHRLVILGAVVGIGISFARLYWVNGYYWQDITVGLVAAIAGGMPALWMLQRRLRKRLRPVPVRSSCTCSGFSCRGGGWGGCDNGGF